ncbi:MULTISPECIES: YaaC family protein [unclassified Sulfitobacter]|uniref:YaaC family protein n=1 Tax=unclassified Sulfitobacter TaxID=196795 RepID=UPI0023E1BC85|nr:MULTISPECIES: YaaC family protein [unclassified Sulfitobacter]MDF3384494.1 hypothetical protein [Sulfitobacter sp. Ks11]MDF3387912.1 hypothetical protein [Sulfitobacter sp. M85]MDF3391332.1 hypothetical protein [Sulfitobacter sp. Ks16]MDF3401970.1 hypothetical protein [Sulfitobacter sp. KE39]MDF3405391.1 hypothetical protein [Sulfitobacter sp. Ks35]
MQFKIANGKKQLKIKNRRIWMHKGVLSPDFESEHVLSSNPWQYVELWLKRDNKIEALAYWRQARRFADASLNLGPEAAPLTLYYCYLNATKALLVTKGVAASDSHGIHGDRPEDAKNMLANEQVNFKSGGILPGLCRHFGEYEEKASYNLKDILWNIPFIHRSFRLTFRSSKELFIPLEKARYVVKPKSSEAYFEAEVLPRFSDLRSLTSIPSSFECYDEGDVKMVRRKKPFRWYSGKAKAPTKRRAIERLKRYHSTTRRAVVHISGNRDLWYLKRTYATNSVGHRHTLILMFAAMHRLSELSRYDPAGFDRHLAGQANWLLTEFIENSADQFVDQIATEITGCQFWPPKVR